MTFMPNPRDEDGWMIPKEGTLGRQIYDLLKQGAGVNEIARRIERSEEYVRVRKHSIIHGGKRYS